MSMLEDLLTNTLVTGAQGQTGSYVDFGIRTNRRSLDVTDLNEALATCRKYKPKVILHLAADTDFDRCERDPEYSYMANGIGTYNMAIAAKEVGAKLVYISTAAVFDGMKNSPYNETDIPSPHNYYGRAKYLGELAIQGMLTDYLIVRVCWVFGGGPQKDQKFVAKIIKQLSSKNEIMAVDDKRGSPSYGKDVINGIKELLRKDEKGIVHLVNEGTPTRFDIAVEIEK